MAINVTTTSEKVTAAVSEDKVTATVSGASPVSATVTAGFGATGGVGPQGPSGVVNVTAPITNAGTTSAADIGISLGEGLSVASGSLRVTPGTYATLVGGTVPSAQLPSYVDDVLEFANVASLPVTGESGKIYVALNTGKIYRWSGSAYFEISTPPDNTDAVPEGSSNLYFTNARARNSFGTGTTGQVVAWSGSEWTAGTVAIASVTGLQTALDARPARGTTPYFAEVLLNTKDEPASAYYIRPQESGPVSYIGFGIGSNEFLRIGLDGRIRWPDGSVQTAPWTGTVAAANVTGLATVATSGNYENLSNRPTLFDGKYSSLSDPPTLFDGKYSSLSDLPTLFDGKYSSLSDPPTLFDGKYSSLSDLPTLFDGDYLSLSSRPTLGTAAAASTDDFAAASHSHAASDVTSGTFDAARLPLATTTTAGAVIVGTGLGVSSGTASVTYGTSSGTACEGNDARLSDSRTPTSHASSHQIGGSDVIGNVVNSPSQITGTQNDYSLPSADVVRLTSDAARTITGFVAGTAGRVVVLVNVGSFAITLSHQSTSSTAANRVIVPWSGDYILDPAYAAVLVYDGATSRWRIV